MSSSKIKNLSQVASSINFSNSSSVSSAADSQIFSDIFEKTRVENVALQNGADDQSGQQNSQDSKAADQSKEAKKADATDAGRKTGETGSAEGGEKSDETANSEELSDAEKSEIEDMESYRLSVDELAKQLNVAMEALQQVKPQAPNIKIVVKGSEASDVQTALKSIDPALLRKVDIHALDEQLKKLMNGDGLVNVEVPKDGDVGVSAFDEAMAAAVENSAAVDDGASAASDADQNALDDALKGVPAEDSGIGGEVLDKLGEMNREGRVRVDFRDALGKIEERGDQVASWQDSLKGMKEGARSLNLQTAEAAGEKPSDAAETFFESMRSFTEKTRFDLAETVNAKSFTFDGGANAPVPAGASSPIVTRDLFLSVAAGQGPAAGAGAALAGPANSVKPGDLDARAAAKIGAKVREIVLESAQAGKSETTRLQIHPETLGKIDIKISMKEKMVTAEIITDNPEAKEAILRHMPQIKAVLASENLMLDHFSARHDQGHFQAQQQASPFSGSDTGGREHRGTASRETAAGPGEMAAIKQSARRLEIDSLINITV